MSDIFHEVEEEVRRERFAELWKQYGDYIIAGVALVVIAIAGWQLYQRYENNQRLQASETLIAAQQAAAGGDIGKATPQFALVAKSSQDGYAKMAKLSQAGALYASGQRSAAVEIYKGVAAQDQGPIGKLALLRAGWAQADSASPSELAALLAPLLAPVEVTTYTWWVIPETKTERNAWRFSAREVLAYADFHAGRFKQAAAGFKALGDDKAAPEAMRSRTGAMAQFLSSGGVSNYGTVPAAPPPPTAPAGGTITAPPAPANGTPPK